MSIAAPGKLARTRRAAARGSASVDEFGDKALFFWDALRHIPTAIRHHKKETVRLIAEIGMGTGSLAVIGGTSLFGGRGSTYSALLGMLVLGSISSGLNLLSVPASVQFMITGAVLLAAAVIDSLSRRGRQSSGRA